MPTINKPTAKRTIDNKRKERMKIYQSGRWSQLRSAYLQDHPLCEMCLKSGIIQPATDVHHVDSFMLYQGNMRLQKAYDYNNLMALCDSCHAKIHNVKLSL